MTNTRTALLAALLAISPLAASPIFHEWPQDADYWTITEEKTVPIDVQEWHKYHRALYSRSAFVLTEGDSSFEIAPLRAYPIDEYRIIEVWMGAWMINGEAVNLSEGRTLSFSGVALESFDRDGQLWGRISGDLAIQPLESIPEPSALPLIGFGFLALLLLRMSSSRLQ
jgi:hypothetical protein